ncbi:MAG: hypothetical protein VX803_04280 [Pseudomonadota bacterium]|nr:hypothetical protein [Pseudomonadota bacterium]
MNLSDRIQNYKQQKEDAQNAAERALNEASDKAITTAFQRVAKNEDALVYAAVEDGCIRVCLAQYRAGDTGLFLSRLLGGKPIPQEVAENISEDMVQSNEGYLSLAHQFAAAGYETDLVQLYTMPKNGPHGLDELWALSSVLPAEPKAEQKPSKNNGGSHAHGM